MHCDEQTDGRGRRGRQWRHGAGNIACSFRTSASYVSQAAGRSAAALLATAQIYDARNIGIKWPNDLISLIPLGKIAGILCESDGTYLDVGIGVNFSPIDTPTRQPADHLPPSSLATSCNVDLPTPQTFILELAANLMTFLPPQASSAVYDNSWQQTLQLLRQYDACHGKALRLEDGNTTLTGTGAGINDDGALLLQHDNGHHICQAGSVFFETCTQ